MFKNMRKVKGTKGIFLISGSNNLEITNAITKAYKQGAGEKTRKASFSIVVDCGNLSEQPEPETLGKLWILSAKINQSGQKAALAMANVNPDHKPQLENKPCLKTSIFNGYVFPTVDGAADAIEEMMSRLSPDDESTNKQQQEERKSAAARIAAAACI